MQETQETCIPFLSWEDPLELEMATHSGISLPGKSHGQSRLVSYSPWGHKESDTIEANEHSTFYFVLFRL